MSFPVQWCEMENGECVEFRVASVWAVVPDNTKPDTRHSAIGTGGLVPEHQS